MDIKLDFFSPYYIFRKATHLFSCKQHEYASRFILSSCEQWLSAEVCGLINDKYHNQSKDRFFCYNENDKRDITFYVCDSSDSPEIKGHAEVKLIYPLQTSKRKAAIDNLIDKVWRCRVTEYPVEGWLFLVWNSYYESRYTSDDFFSIVTNEIQESLNSKYREMDLSTWEIIEPHNFCDSEIKWRGSNRIIKVKAIPFTFFSKEFSHYKNDDIESMLLIGRDYRGRRL